MPTQAEQWQKNIVLLRPAPTGPDGKQYTVGTGISCIYFFWVPWRLVPPAGASFFLLPARKYQPPRIGALQEVGPHSGGPFRGITSDCPGPVRRDTPFTGPLVPYSARPGLCRDNKGMRRPIGPLRASFRIPVPVLGAHADRDPSALRGFGSPLRGTVHQGGPRLGSLPRPIGSCRRPSLRRRPGPPPGSLRASPGPVRPGQGTWSTWVALSPLRGPFGTPSLWSGSLCSPGPLGLGGTPRTAPARDGWSLGPLASPSRRGYGLRSSARGPMAAPPTA